MNQSLKAGITTIIQVIIRAVSIIVRTHSGYRVVTGIQKICVKRNMLCYFIKDIIQPIYPPLLGHNESVQCELTLFVCTHTSLDCFVDMCRFPHGVFVDRKAQGKLQIKFST